MESAPARFVGAFRLSLHNVRRDRFLGSPVSFTFLTFTLVKAKEKTPASESGLNFKIRTLRSLFFRLKLKVNF